MTTKVQQQLVKFSVSPDSTIRQALQAIDAGALGVALIVDPESQRFHGLVTDGDLRRALLKGLGLEAPISSVERPETRTAPLGTPIEQLSQTFSDPVRIVPLLDEEGRVAELALLDRRVRLPVAAPSLGEKELEYVMECVLTNWISSAGKFVTRFEEEFAAFCGTQYAIATSNGTTALHLALVALDTGPGDEVIVPSMTFIATANAVAYTGATPIFVDSELESWNMDPAQVAAAITPRTRAIIPVHIYGHPANMEPLLKLAEQHNLPVIEDAAEAHGACYQGRVVGGIGDMGMFSFYGNKLITTGEGGMITTNHADLAEKLKILRDHGMSKERRYWHPVLGYNYRLTNLQAAIGVAQLEKITAILADRQRIAQAYTERLQSVPGLHLPPRAAWATNVYWLFSILIDEQTFGRSRDEVMALLREENIDTRPLFPPVHTQPIYNTGQHLPVAERLGNTGLSLPTATGMQLEDIHRVVTRLAELYCEASS